MGKAGLKRAAEYLKGPGGIRLLVAVGMAGILLILLSELLPSGKDGEADQGGDTVAEQTLLLEQRLEKIVSGIDGTGRCRVMVTLENGVKYVYADVAGTAGMTGRDAGALVTELQPTVKGVAVVCEGGNDEGVRRRVTEAVTAVLHITANRVCVVAGNGE